MARAAELRDARKDASAALDDWVVGEYEDKRPLVEVLLAPFNKAPQVLSDFNMVFKLVESKVAQEKLQHGRQLRY